MTENVMTTRAVGGSVSGNNERSSLAYNTHEQRNVEVERREIEEIGKAWVETFWHNTSLSGQRSASVGTSTFFPRGPITVLWFERIGVWLIPVIQTSVVQYFAKVTHRESTKPMNFTHQPAAEGMSPKIGKSIILKIERTYTPSSLQ